MLKERSGGLRLRRSVWAGVAVILSVAPVVLGCHAGSGLSLHQSDLVSPNGAITQAADEARTSWYPDQPGLDPAIVGGTGFGRLFKTALTLTPGEQVLAQPLVYNGKVFVTTEANNLYLLDAVTGAITNSRALGAAYDAPGNLGCRDIQPTVGITGTPVIDTSSSTAYFFSKSSAGTWTFHAVDATNLAERGGFPVTISGTAQNEPTQTFDGVHQHQRPGLLLMNGVVYGGFGAHCDVGTYQGWVVGVSTSGQIRAMFSTEQGAGETGHGAGIWMSGGGLASDGAGNILFSTGNGYNVYVYPNPIPSNTDPGPLEETVTRVVVQADGTLKTTDFFAPFNAGTLADSDLGSGGVVALPSQFGTASIPHLAMVSGKEGYFYLLNRDHLGGYQQGPAGGDAYLSRVSLGGSTWQHPAAWPGDGGYMYVTVNGDESGPNTFCLEAIKYGTDTNGNPTATYVAKSTETFGSYSGSPIVTSNGTGSGTALVWAVANTSDIRAYDAVPVNGTLTLRYSDTYNNAAKFTTVGVGAGRVYVGSGDGNVIGYGAMSPPPVSGGPVDFGAVVVGQSSTINVTFTANQNMTVQSFSTTNSVYQVGTSTPPVPNAMTSSQTMTAPVTFTPTAAGNVSASLTVVTSAGTALVTLTGVGQVNGHQLTATPPSLNFGSVATGTSKSISVVLQNSGNQTLTFGASTLPAAPFSATGVPASGSTLAASASVTATATFSPTTDGTWSDSLVVASDGGNVTINLAATSGAPPNLQITPLTLNFGQVATGAASVMTFVLKNTGGTNLTITKSKPPALGQFTATTTLTEGSVTTASAQVTESVTFTSQAAGSFTDSWIITGNDSNGTQTVRFNATAVAPLSRTGWTPVGVPTGADIATNAIDGNIATRWSTGAAQAPGQYFQVDMGGVNTFGIVQMDSGSNTGEYAHGYQVFMSNDGTNWGTAIASGNPTSGPVITVNFPTQTARYIRVVQTSNTPANGWSIHEFNVYGTSTPRPNPPTGLTATAASASAINLSWTASTTTGVTYTVFRSMTSGFTPGAGNQIATGISGTTYTDSGLATSTTYYYLAQANDSSGTSSSNQAQATTQAAAPPSPPTNLTATAASTSAINLSWTASTTTGVTYTVFRSTTSGFTPGAGNQIATGLTNTTYADSGLATSTTYYYLAQANRSSDKSQSSNQATTTTQGPAGAGGSGGSGGSAGSGGAGGDASAIGGDGSGGAGGAGAGGSAGNAGAGGSAGVAGSGGADASGDASGSSDGSGSDSGPDTGEAGTNGDGASGSDGGSSSVGSGGGSTGGGGATSSDGSTGAGGRGGTAGCACNVGLSGPADALPLGLVLAAVGLFSRARRRRR